VQRRRPTSGTKRAGQVFVAAGLHQLPRRRAADADEMREAIAALGELRMDSLGRIVTDDPDARRVIDDPGLQVPLLGIRQRLRWIASEEADPRMDVYMVSIR
jgi:hypothetical protein